MKLLTLEEANASQGLERSYAYSALDAMGTREIADTLLPRLDPETRRIYGFERAAQAPALYMMHRGIRVNVVKSAELTNELSRELRKAEKDVAAMPEVLAVWDAKQLLAGACPKNPKRRKDGKPGYHKWPRGVEDSPDKHCELCGASRVVPKPFSASSPAQGKHLFYDLYGVRKQYGKDGEVTLDDEALQRIGRQYPKHKAVVEAVQQVRDLVKQLGFLKAKLSPDNRFHASVNVGTAWTGRWSTSKNPFGYGANAQNIGERHRAILVADPGYTMFYADLERAESDIVAHLAGDERYIEAHKLGDPHTYVARLVWPDELPWTGDLKQDKKVAKALPPWDPVEGHEYRFQAKRIQHGSNYGLTPPGISMIAHIPLVAARKAFHNYHDEFPHIKGWQSSVKERVVGQLPLYNPLGRRIRLFGRPWDGHTYKQGLSFGPQSAVADIIAIAIWRLWTEAWPLVELQMQIHDAILGQFRTEDTERAVAEIRRLMSIPFDVTDYRGNTRRMTIGVEVLIGQNFGKFDKDKNPKGLRDAPH